jgi:anti-sigma B factor antagonist
MRGSLVYAGSGSGKAMAKSVLNFEIEDTNGIRLIHISGPLDSVTYDQCRAYLDPLISRSHARLVLDCRNLTYVNSRGLGLLMHYQRTATLGFSFFGIAALGPHTLKSIQLLGLDKFLTWYPTIENALEMAAAI